MRKENIEKYLAHIHVNVKLHYFMQVYTNKASEPYVHCASWFALNLYGSEKAILIIHVRSRNYAEYNVAELDVQFRIIDHFRIHR